MSVCIVSYITRKYSEQFSWQGVAGPCQLSLRIVAPDGEATAGNVCLHQSNNIWEGLCESKVNLALYQSHILFDCIRHNFFLKRRENVGYIKRYSLEEWSFHSGYYSQLGVAQQSAAKRKWINNELAKNTKLISNSWGTYEMNWVPASKCSQFPYGHSDPKIYKIQGKNKAQHWERKEHICRARARHTSSIFLFEF